MKIDNFSIGSDVEYFLQDKETKEIVSAEGLIEGTKHEPFHFDAENDFFATSLDNVMAEGNIPPCNSPMEFYQSVEKLLNYINKTIPNNLQAISIPSARLDQKYLQTENAQLFGCEPSLNCWTTEVVQPQPTGDNVRCTGFHIHVGYNNPDEEQNFALAKAMDLFLGIPSVVLEPKNERKMVGYGKSGNFRHQRHGMEYRSLSGYFAASRSLIEWCYNQTIQAITFLNKGGLVMIEDMGDEIQNIINHEDIEGAKALINKYDLKLAE